jgi:uncharacterized protein
MPTPPESAFEPAWWLSHSHLQTLWATLFRRGPRPALHRERLELVDGDFLDLDWLARSGRTCAPDRPTVLILHGLEGSSRSPYAWGMMDALGQWGWNAVVVHFRGCSGEPNRTARRYHSGETGDLAATVEHLISAHGIRTLAAVGFSLGGNVLVKWLGETGADNPLRCAVAVSAPLVLERCAERLERGFSRAYQWWLMRSMRASVLSQFSSDRGCPIDRDRVRRSRTFREFDDLVTAPLHGFADADDYYARASGRQFLARIRIPTLLVHARDDPFMYPDVMPARDELASWVELDAPSRGGHVGFVSGRLPWRPRYWLEERAPQFLASHLEPGRNRR